MKLRDVSCRVQYELKSFFKQSTADLYRVLDSLLLLKQWYVYRISHSMGGPLLVVVLLSFVWSLELSVRSTWEVHF